MNKACIVVANAGVARFYDVEEVEASPASFALVKRLELTNDTDLKSLGESATGRVRTETNTNRSAGPVHPIGEQRERHRGELERRFGQEIARHAGEITRGWPDGVVVVVAEPKLLGLVREPIRKALHHSIELKELAKDYTNLPAQDLLECLSPGQLLPAHRIR